MKISNVLGDPTNIPAKKEPLAMSPVYRPAVRNIPKLNLLFIGYFDPKNSFMHRESECFLG